MKPRGVLRFACAALAAAALMVPARSAGAETFGWWRFEEGEPGAEVTTLRDWGEDGQSEGTRSGGDVMGAPVYIETTHGVDIGGLPDRIALDMDGFDDYVPNMPAIEFDLFATFTVEAVIYWRGIPENPPEGRRATSMIIQQSDGEATGRSWLFIQEDDLTLRSFIGGATTMLEGVEVPAQQWIYVGFTYDDGFVTLWMDTDLSDGIDPASNTATDFHDFEDNSAPLIIGRHKSLIDNFHGMISELRITDSGFGEGPLPENPPDNHFTATPAAFVNEWAVY